MKSNALFLCILFACTAAVLSGQTTFSERSGRRLYDPSWLPPPVGVTGSTKTRRETAAAPAEEQQNTCTEKTEKTAPTGKFTSMKELRNLLNSRLAKNFLYPVQAKERRIEGVVDLLLDISTDGKLLSWKQRGNPPPILVRAAVGQVQSVFPLPVQLERSVTGFGVTVTYTLE